MGKIIKIVFLSLFLLVVPATADHNTTIDRFYTYISQQVLDSSSYLDATISKWLGYDGNSSQCISPDKVKPKLRKNVDHFFLNNKYINDTDDIYIRLRFKTFFNSRKKIKFSPSLSAQFPFIKCKTQWKLFFTDVDKSQNEIKPTDEFTGGFGLRYDQEKYFGIDASHSLGLYRGSPYIRSRLKMPFFYHSWKIEPVQIFKYSLKYDFEEETNIYFDRPLGDDSLFRFQLHRKSASKMRGMDYGMTYKFYKYIGKNSGIEFSQAFFGNTYYNDFYANDPHYNGINNYVTSVGVRSNIWRDWLYLEVRPSVNFHKDHGYHPTYSLRFYMDIYFGKYD